MNDRKKMDIRLKIIEELYDGDGQLAERIHVERPDLSKELESMHALKSALDARPGRRPDAATFNAVLKAAADPSSELVPENLHPARREDRPPRARRALYLRSAGVATAVLTVLIAVTTVWQAGVLDDTVPVAGSDVVSGLEEELAPTADEVQIGHQDLAAVDNTESGERPAPSVAVRPADRHSAVDRTFLGMVEEDGFTSEGHELLIAGRDLAGEGGMSAFKAADRDIRRRPSDILPVGMRPMSIAAFGGESREAVHYIQAPDEELAWDHAADVMEMYQQIEMIGEGVSHGWEPASVPLEMVSPSRQNRGSSIQPVNERRIP